jgi:hypothetical protein
MAYRLCQRPLPREAQIHLPEDIEQVPFHQIGKRFAVCTENLIDIDGNRESLKLR